MTSPYKNRPRKSFWKTSVPAEMLRMADLYSKRFTIGPECRIATAGSCFAQHISTHLAKRGYKVIDAERPPSALSPDVARSFGYLLYSARYGNIYTARQMLQLAQECFGLFTPSDIVWSKNERYFDALRPAVEPKGLDSVDEVYVHRAHHLSRVRQVFETADLLVFTLGLTEAWIHASGTVYPTAPETIAGRFSPEIHKFKNFTYEETLADLVALRQLLKEKNPKLRMLLTVSPVPLNATASEQHVLVATTYSKAVLRAAAGALYLQFDDVDYFPSYEIIATPFVGRCFYDLDLRSVTPEGVAAVMEAFFSAHAEAERAENLVASPTLPREPLQEPDEDVVCEEKLLEAFAR